MWIRSGQNSTHTFDKRLASQPWPVTIYSDADDEDDDSGKRMRKKKKMEMRLWALLCFVLMLHAIAHNVKQFAVRALEEPLPDWWRQACAEGPTSTPTPTSMSTWFFAFSWRSCDYSTDTLLIHIAPPSPSMKNPELPVEMDEVEVKVDIQSTNASADEPRTAKRQGFELARIPEDPASKPTALSSPKKPKAASSSSSSPRAQPPACQVEKCAADLADAKEYYRRHRVCEQHSKARVVLVLGLQQRFCQQCSRFHVLEEFDEAKRSCRRRLAGHNERRRKTPSDSSVDRLDSNHHLNDNWLRDKMTMVLERNTTAKVCKEIKNH